MVWILIGLIVPILVLGWFLIKAGKRQDRAQRISHFIAEEMAAIRDEQRKELQVLQQKNGYLRDRLPIEKEWR